MSTKIPSIPNVSEETVLQVVEALKNTLDVREGRIGDQLDKGVTFRDLVGLGLAQDKSQEVVQQSFTTNQITNNLPVYSMNYNFEQAYDPTTDLTPPPQANELFTKTTINTVFLSWNIPSYRNHSFSEIWRSENDNIGDAVLIGQSTTNQFVDNVVPDIEFYYWIRLVSKADITGAYSLEPVSAKAEVSPKFIISAVEGEIGNSSLNIELGNRINQIENDTQRILQNDLGSTIAEETVIREQVEGGLLSQYTVKIDDNGAVSGFGLASQTVDGSVESAFIIRADKFAIVQPTSTSTTLTGTPASASIPFTVDSDGRTIIKSGVIGSASISNANIESLATYKLTAGVSESSVFQGGQGHFDELSAGSNRTFSYSTDANGNRIDITTINGASMFIGDTYARFNADYFKINNSQGTQFTPFEVSNNVVRINTAVIGDATIGFAKISDDIQSTNYSSGSSGWRIFKNGNAEFNNITLGGGTGFATSSDLNGKVNSTGGTLTAGLVKSSDNKFIIDLSNKSITITS